MKLAIRDALLINEGTQREADVLIADGRIERIGGSINDTVDREIDAAGKWLLPGMIDDQVHFREPGMEHKGTIATESRAAVAGGITSYMEMPNCNPLTVNAGALLDKHARAAEHSMANYGFYLGATNDNLEEIKSVDIHRACGIKVFMGASTGNMLVDNVETLEGIFASSPLLIATHCEDTPTITANEKAAYEKYGEEIPFSEHPHIRSVEACYASSSLAVDLAKRFGSRLHVLHITTARELELFTAGDATTKQITAEACVHHLYFNESWYTSLGADIKCNPAIKSHADQLGIRRAVKDDVIDVIATDHAPHTADEKAGNYLRAPAGLPLVQHAMLILIDIAKSGDLTIEKVVEKCAHTPARLFDVKERGFIREGYWADLVVVDPESETIVDDEPVLAKCGWTPFRGVTFRSRIETTLVNGEIVYSGGQIHEGTRGRPLEYDR